MVPGRKSIVLLAILVVAILGLARTESDIAQAQGLDLNRHCQNHGYARVVLVENTAYGWQCEGADGSRSGLSVESACHEQYGSNWHAQYSNFNDPNSWTCIQENAAPPPPPPAQPPPSGGSQPAPSHGMNIDGYCKSKGDAGARFSGDAYSWECFHADGSNSGGIDVDSVCRFSSGNVYPYAHLGNQADPYSWSCQDYPQGQRPSGSTGSGGNNSTQNNTQPSTSTSTCPNLSGQRWIGSTTVLTGTYLRVNSSGLRVRQGPGTNTCILGFVESGKYYPVTQTQNGWALISGTYGAGWVSTSYSTVYAAPQSGDGNSAPTTTTNQVLIKTISGENNSVDFHDPAIFLGHVTYEVLVTYSQSGAGYVIRGVTVRFGLDPVDQAQLLCYIVADVEVYDHNNRLVAEDRGHAIGILFITQGKSQVDLAVFKDVGQSGKVAVTFLYSCAIKPSSELVSSDPMQNAQVYLSIP